MRILFITFIYILTIGVSLAQNDSINYNLISLEELANIEVITASKKLETATDAPANIYVISGEEIINRGYRSLFDLLQDLPGVTNSTQIGEIFTGTPSVRGLFHPKRLKLMINGMTIDPKDGSGTGWTERFPIEGIDRIEFIIGPYASVYGRNSFSGVLNVILKDSQKIGNGIASVLYGEYKQMQASIVLAKKINNFDIYMSVFKNKSEDGIDLVKEYPEFYSLENRLKDSLWLNDSTILYPTFAEGVSEEFVMPWDYFDYYFGVKYKNELSFNFQANFAEYSKVGPKFTPLFYSANKDAKINDNLLNASLRYDKEINNKLSSSSNLVFQKYDWIGRNYYLNGDKRWYTKDNISYLVGQDFRYELLKNSSLLLGATYEYLILHPFFASTTPEALFGDEQINSFINLSIQSESYFFNDKLRLVLGLMYENSTAYNPVFIPRVSIRYKLTETTVLKTLYGAGYLSPSSIVQADQIVSYTKGTNDINPEYIDSYEFSITQSITKRYRLNVSLFHNNVKDVIQLVNDNTLKAPFLKQYKNIGTKQSYGFDFTLNAQPIKFLSIFASYSYLDGSYDKLNEDQTSLTKVYRLPVAAENIFKAGINISIWKGKINLYIHDLLIGSRTTWDNKLVGSSQQNATSNYKLEGYNLVDLSIRTTKRLNKNTSFSVGIRNLFDKKAFDPIYEIQNVTVFPPIRRRWWNVQLLFHF